MANYTKAFVEGRNGVDPTVIVLHEYEGTSQQLDQEMIVCDLKSAGKCHVSYHAGIGETGVSEYVDLANQSITFSDDEMQDCKPCEDVQLLAPAADTPSNEYTINIAVPSAINTSDFCDIHQLKKTADYVAQVLTDTGLTVDAVLRNCDDLCDADWDLFVQCVEFSLTQIADPDAGETCPDCECIGVVRDEEGNPTALQFAGEDGIIEVPLGDGSGANTFGTAVDNGDGTSTATFPDGTSITACNTCGGAGSDTFVTWAVNDDGSVTLTSADGNATVTFDDTDTTLIYTQNADGSVTISNPDGSDPVVIGLPTGCCPVENTENVPPAIDADPPAVNPDGTTGNPVITLDGNGNIAYISYYVNGQWVTCACSGGTNGGGGTGDPHAITEEGTTGTTPSEHQAQADVIAGAGNAGDLIKLTDSNNCVFTYIVSANGDACCVDGPEPERLSDVRVITMALGDATTLSGDIIGGNGTDAVLYTSPDSAPFCNTSCCPMEEGALRVNITDYGTTWRLDPGFFGYMKSEVSLDGGVNWWRYDVSVLDSRGDTFPTYETTHHSGQLYNQWSSDPGQKLSLDVGECYQAQIRYVVEIIGGTSSATIRPAFYTSGFRIEFDGTAICKK